MRDSWHLLCSVALLPTSGRAMLELGCGAGRMTHSFAKRFERVYAFDLSPEMLRRARAIHKGQSNILWLLGNGADLSCVASGSLDFVFSYLVLQHLPEETLAFRYVHELLRVLRPGRCVSVSIQWRLGTDDEPARPSSVGNCGRAVVHAAARPEPIGGGDVWLRSVRGGKKLARGGDWRAEHEG